MYIFIDDTEESKEIIKLLKEKSKSGVRVIMVLDAFGSYGLSKKVVEEMRDSGVEILFFKWILRRLHRKILIVDDKIAFVGGVNIHHAARAWTDLLIRVEGKIVSSILWSFRKIYKISGGKDKEIISQKRKTFADSRIWLIEHIPFVRKPKLRDAYMEAILKAKQKITLVTPYFLPHRWMKKLLIETSERGIKVEILVPKETDHNFFDRANRRYISMLAEKGIDFYLTNEMNHAKLLLIDDTLALVGSQNVDALSFDFNAEVGLFFTNKKMIDDLQKIVDKWKNNSSYFDEEVHIIFIDKVFSFVIKWLQPFL